MHIMQIKHCFKQKNIKKDYKKQILDHNIKKFNLIIRDNIDMFSSTKTLINVDKNAILQVIFVNDTKNITKDWK